ncbi:hypothetical protein AGMMS49982_23060 [Bacteroidia bacterium]|nr:hypothetical protein AGMMS49982_23060 [Bacteroidia bacterium]
MGNIGFRTGKKIIQTDNIMPLLNQSRAQMGAKSENGGWDKTDNRVFLGGYWGIAIVTAATMAEM